MLLSSKADANVKTINGKTAFQLASKNGYKYTIKMLLKGGADGNIKTNENWAPLNWVDKDGRCRVIEELLNSNADVDAKTSNGITPFYGKLNIGNKDAVKMRLKSGVFSNITIDEEWFALHCAASKGNCKIIGSY